MWEVHVCKTSTYVLKPQKLGTLREVARDNILKLGQSELLGNKESVYEKLNHHNIMVVSGHRSAKSLGIEICLSLINSVYIFEFKNTAVQCIKLAPCCNKQAGIADSNLLQAHFRPNCQQAGDVSTRGFAKNPEP